MRSLLARLWADDTGAVISTELVMVMGVGVLGAGAGVKMLRDATLHAFERTGATIRALAPDPESAKALAAPPGPAQPPQAAANALAVNHVVVNVYPPASRFEPPAP